MFDVCVSISCVCVCGRGSRRIDVTVAVKCACSVFAAPLDSSISMNCLYVLSGFKVFMYNFLKSIRFHSRKEQRSTATPANPLMSRQRAGYTSCR